MSKSYSQRACIMLYCAFTTTLDTTALGKYCMCPENNFWFLDFRSSLRVLWLPEKQSKNETYVWYASASMRISGGKKVWPNWTKTSLGRGLDLDLCDVYQSVGWRFERAGLNVPDYWNMYKKEEGALLFLPVFGNNVKCIILNFVGYEISLVSLPDNPS